MGDFSLNSFLLLLRHGLFCHGFRVKSEQSAAAEVKDKTAQEQRKKVFRQIRNGCFGVNEGNDEIAETDIVEKHREVRVKKDEHCNKNKERDEG